MSREAPERILQHLDSVQRLRAARAGDAALCERLQALKTYQAQRFRLSYADLLADGRHGPAARFFLHELYGPQEFGARDAQFARIVPALVRLFSTELVDTVALLGELHALSEQLDDAGARWLDTPRLDAAGYVRLWQAVGSPPQRERQITLTLQIGAAMDRYTRSRLLRSSLRLMRGPAQAAGLGALQQFLEAGFDAFGAMGGAAGFLQTVGQRERALATALYSHEAITWATNPSTPASAPRPAALAQLP